MTVYSLLSRRNTNEYNFDDIFLLLTMHINYYYDEIYFNEPIMQFFEDSEPLLRKLIIENPNLTRRQLGSSFLAFNLMMIISLAGRI
jgi:hypothetical protein